MDFSHPIRLVKVIPARLWNAEVRRFARSRPLHVRVERVRRFRHPWSVSAAWDAEVEAWRLAVHPGYVNGGETMVRMRSGDAPPETAARLGIEPAAARDLIDARLSEGPRLPVASGLWRPIGTDAVAVDGAADPVPPFFAARGVVAPLERVTTTGGSLSVSRGSADQPRLLRAADLVLQHPRPALFVGYESVDAGLGAEITVRPAVGSTRVQVRRRYQRFDGAETSVAQLASGLVDDGIDELHLATVYLLSQPGAEAGSAPDGTWSAYVRHRVFWNLRHDIDVELEAVRPQALIFTSAPLAGGVAEPVVQSILKSVSEAATQLIELLNRSRIRGAFWTV